MDLIEQTLFAPPNYPRQETASDDPRFASIVNTSSIEEADVLIFGVPTDEGIRRNGGRPGASKAPHAIRQWLGKLTTYAGPQFQNHLDSLKICDLGDVQGRTLEEVHDLASSCAESFARENKITIALGGGHDITYPLAKGFGKSSTGGFGLINVDAHLDVRPKKDGLHHSGSSFRLLLEEGVVNPRKFAEIGMQSFAASQAHFDWLINQGSRVLTFEDATTAHLPNAFEECEFAITLGDESLPLYLSFDVDCVRASDAPGVSAPAPIGFLAEEVYELAVAAGLSRHVRMMDFVEMNPEFDRDGITARLAARMIAAFLAGVANREQR